MRLTKNNIALFLAILFHSCGVIGILFTPYKEWFISHTSFTLLLMSVLLIFTQTQKNRHFFLFVIIAFTTGILVEMLGIHTGLLFGSYHYGTVLGYHLNGVPLLIGVNWFVIVYCCGNITGIIQSWTEKKYSDANMKLSPHIRVVSLIFDGAILAVIFDYIMEPVAVKLGLWQWDNGTISFFNYCSWFLVSALLLIVFRLLKFNKHNHFAVHLFIIQVLFFLALRIYL